MRYQLSYVWKDGQLQWSHMKWSVENYGGQLVSNTSTPVSVTSCLVQKRVYFASTLAVQVGRLWFRKWLWLPVSPSFRGSESGCSDRACNKLFLHNFMSLPWTQCVPIRAKHIFGVTRNFLYGIYTIQWINFCRKRLKTSTKYCKPQIYPTLLCSGFLILTKQKKILKFTWMQWNEFLILATCGIKIEIPQLYKHNLPEGNNV